MEEGQEEEEVDSCCKGGRRGCGCREEWGAAGGRFAPYLELCDDCDDASRAPSHEDSPRDSSHGPSAVGGIVPWPGEQDCATHAESYQHAQRESDESDGGRVDQHRDEKFFHVGDVQLGARGNRDEGDHEIVDVAQAREFLPLENLQNIGTTYNPCN